ncbi:MAG: hypothetical protein KAU28_01480 [Phycisphaerae bacterium]|nr:hypothetical protein [Phycisphaerae bacterium]
MATMWTKSNTTAMSHFQFSSDAHRAVGTDAIAYRVIKRSQYHTTLTWGLFNKDRYRLAL